MTIIRPLVITAASLLLAACSKLTQENYDQISVGETTYDDAVALLGEPSECNSVLNAKSCTWGQDQKSINIKFIADKVVSRSGKGLN